MIAGFHSITLAAREPAAAADAYERFFGVPALRDGSGVRFGLANLVLSLAAGKAEGVARVTFAVRDLDHACRLLGRRGVPTQREEDGAMIDASASHGVELAIAPAEERSAAPAASDAILGLDHVVIRTGAPDRAIALYGARLGLDFRLDRCNPAWGGRLLFFRCGDAVVEIAAGADAPPELADGFGGLAWRARDPAAAHARLSRAGVDVSDLRKGRKPGTQVFTVRSGLAAAPALVIGAGEDAP